MNDYLINAIALADTAFQSMAPGSSKGCNKINVLGGAEMGTH